MNDRYEIVCRIKMTGDTLLKLSYFIGCILTCLSSDAPRTRVDSGEITGGRQYTYKNHRQLYSFIGIPYAKPPVGKYRFKETQPLSPWLGVWNATTPGSACLGTDYEDVNYGIIGQEDCLYVNVYTPKLPKENESGSLMDVVVYIHGGAYMGGQGNNFGPEYLLDDNDFVFVTINYRLGVLGFATTGDGVLPANNGMKDQVAALRWIRRNIAAFGGDPDKVTITGMSAGAGSVHYHLISPMSNGLFNRAIIQSGSAYSHWSYAENITQKTSRIAEILGCPTSISEEIVECLRSRPAKKISESVNEFMPWLFNPFSPFGPTVESVGDEPRFLPDVPKNLVAYDVPVLMSVTQDEGYCLTVDILSKNLTDDLNNNWNEHLPHLLDYNYTISNKLLKSKIAKDIKEFYFGDKPISIETKSNITKMLSDRMFGYSMSKAAQNIASTNTAPVYFHEFGYGGKYSIFVDPTYHSRGSEVSHGDDTMYVLKCFGKTPHDNEEDTKMIKIMVKMWASFIKTGVPDIGNSATWLPVSKNPADPFKYIKITQDQTFEPKEHSNYGNYEFWSSLPLTEFDEINISNDINHIEL